MAGKPAFVVFIGIGLPINPKKNLSLQLYRNPDMDREDIIYLKNEEVNRRKWDSAVSQSPFYSLFGYSWFLDTVCQTWDALITGDYKHVMPIPVVNSLYQQMQQYLLWTGIYGAEIPSRQVAETFINRIPDSYNGLYLNLNKLCDITNVENGLIRYD